jgi:hypothetical protein
VRSLFLVALTATLAIAQSAPNWWAYASPEATALVGIQWSHLRHSPFAAAIEAEILPSGALGFPNLDCLRQAEEIVISSPALVAAEAGSFPPETVQDQAQRQGMRGLVYRGVQLWLPPEADTLGVAQISEQLVLVGAQKNLQTAVDGGLAETGRANSPLLARAARFSQTGDLWVAAVKLPDPLASLFVPLDADASDFLGQVSVRNGLAMEASFDAGSEKAAAEFARDLRERAPSFPAFARGLEAVTDRRRVTIALQVGSEDPLAVLHSTPVPAPARLPAASGVIEAAVAPEGSAGPSQPPNPVTFEITHVEASQPRIIFIFNLEEGTREIEITQVETSQPRIIHIFNPDEGSREIVLPSAP